MGKNLYPSGIDGFPVNPIATGFIVHPYHVSDLWDIVSGIEQTIGVLPLDGYPSLSERISGLDGAFVNTSGDTVTGNITLQDANILSSTFGNTLGSAGVPISGIFVSGLRVTDIFGLSPITLHDKLQPNASGTVDLGTTTFPYNDIYTDDIFVSGQSLNEFVKSADNDHVNTSGDIMTGPLTVPTLNFASLSGTVGTAQIIDQGSYTDIKDASEVYIHNEDETAYIDVFDQLSIEGKDSLSLSVSGSQFFSMDSSNGGRILIERNVLPNISGVIDLGTPSNPWRTIYTDNVISSSGTEATTAQNIGAGNGVFSAKIGNDLRFKSLLPSGTLAIIPQGDDLILSGIATIINSTDDVPEGSTNLYYTGARVSGVIDTQKGLVNGLASLNSLGQVPNSQIPALAITETFVVGSWLEQTGIFAAQTGDIAVRTDLNETYILQTEPASLSGNWQRLLTPTDNVLSVNGETGIVTLDTDDITEGVTNLYYTEARVNANSSVTTNATNISTVSGVAAQNAIDIATVSGVSATALQNVVEDITPQLGGNLDANGMIISDTTGDLQLLANNDANKGWYIGTGGLVAAIDNVGGEDGGFEIYPNNIQMFCNPTTGGGSLTMGTANVQTQYNGALGTTLLQLVNGGIILAGTGGQFLQLTAGTTALRPSSPANGMLRYNTTNNKLEGYQSGSWLNLVSDETADVAFISGLVDTNINDIAFISGLTDTNISNIATNVTNIAFVSGIATTNTGDIAFISGLVDTNTNDIAFVSGLSSTALQNVIEDATPQLGGNLDANGFDLRDATGAYTVAVTTTGILTKGKITPTTSGIDDIGDTNLPYNDVRTNKVNGGIAVQWTLNEVPTPEADGVETDFTLTNVPFTTDSIMLYKNGVYMAVSGISSATTDYSVDGAVIKFVTAPVTGSTIIANYTHL